MRAVVVSGFGPPGVARIADLPMPQYGDNDILIAVVAAGVNPVDWKECEGHFAKARGLHVAATCSSSNLEYVSSLGADLVVDYQQGNIIPAVRRWRPEGVHAIVDCVSGNSLPDALESLRDLVGG
jgi:NADPH:quinone reductase-like Zn-dependent oxidoreductase